MLSQENTQAYKHLRVTGVSVCVSVSQSVSPMFSRCTLLNNLSEGCGPTKYKLTHSSDRKQDQQQMWYMLKGWNKRVGTGTVGYVSVLFLAKYLYPTVQVSFSLKHELVLSREQNLSTFLNICSFLSSHFFSS